MNHGMNQTAATGSPRELGTLEGELSSHAHGINELAHAVDALEAGMHGVLRPEPPKPADPPAPSTGARLESVHPVPSPLVQEVRRQQENVQILIARVNGMRARLEA